MGLALFLYFVLFAVLVAGSIPESWHLQLARRFPWPDGFLSKLSSWIEFLVGCAAVRVVGYVLEESSGALLALGIGISVFFIFEGLFRIVLNHKLPDRRFPSLLFWVPYRVFSSIAGGPA